MQILLRLNNIRLEGWHLYIGLFSTDTVILQQVNVKEKKESSLLQEMFLDILKELVPLGWDEGKNHRSTEKSCLGVGLPINYNH